MNRNEVLVHEISDIELPQIADHVLSYSDNYNFTSLLLNNTEHINRISFEQFINHPYVMYGGSGFVVSITIAIIAIVCYKLLCQKKKYPTYRPTSIEI